jgi:hypothetical protein
MGPKRDPKMGPKKRTQKWFPKMDPKAGLGSNLIQGPFLGSTFRVHFWIPFLGVFFECVFGF